MKRFFHIASLMMMVCSGILLLGSCYSMPVGYLKTDNATFVPDTVYAYRNINPSSERAQNGAPWSSVRIQGVSGTKPINYEYADVKATKGGDKAAFEKMVQAGHLLVQGGTVQLFQDGVKAIPNGTYTISLRVYNEGYSNVLTDIITFVVDQDEPTTVDEGGMNLGM